MEVDVQALFTADLKIGQHLYDLVLQVTDHALHVLLRVAFCRDDGRQIIDLRLQPVALDPVQVYSFIDAK